MTGGARTGADQDESSRGAPGAASAEPTLGQLLAEPIVRQLMGRDQTYEATIRVLLQHTGFARVAARAEGDPFLIILLLIQIARMWRRRFDRDVRARLPGMTGARCALLIHFARHEGINQVALAQILDIEPITLVWLLDRLETADLVTRLPLPDDCRAYALALTANARPIIQRIHELTTKIEDDLRLGLSKANASQLRALLYRIRANLTDRLGEVPSAEQLGWQFGEGGKSDD